MVVNIIVLSAIGLFIVFCAYDSARKFIGHNPNAPRALARLKAWWPGFVKRHIVDVDPYQDEGHSITRYYPHDADEGPKR